MRKLTDKQERFCEEYIVDLNATAAYQRAGYSATGAAARVNASRLLTNANVAARIQQLKDERSARTLIKADRVLEEFARLGFSDLRKILTWDERSVRLKPADEIEDFDAAAIREITETVVENENGILTRRNVKLHDKLGALRDLARHLGIFGDERIDRALQVNVSVDARRQSKEEEFEHLFREIDRYRAEADVADREGGRA